MPHAGEITLLFGFHVDTLVERRFASVIRTAAAGVQAFPFPTARRPNLNPLFTRVVNHWVIVWDDGGRSEGYLQKGESWESLGGGS